MISEELSLSAGFSYDPPPPPDYLVSRDKDTFQERVGVEGARDRPAYFEIAGYRRKHVNANTVSFCLLQNNDKALYKLSVQRCKQYTQICCTLTKLSAM